MVHSSATPVTVTHFKLHNYYRSLHFTVVTLLGNNTINQSMPEWGPYEYLNILDSLRNRGFNVISENWKQGIEDALYSAKIVRQIDALFKSGLKPRNVIVVGASAGAAIVINISAKLTKDELKYVTMGGCWPDTYKEYLPVELYGNFLSVIESIDPHGTCYKIFEGLKAVQKSSSIWS